MILVDGDPRDTIPADDRGLQYGDGLFETLAVFDGVPRRWPRHYARLTQGGERLGIPVPDEAQLLAEIGACAGAEAACVVKLILTRGSGGRGYRAPEASAPRRILSSHPLPDYPESYYREGVAVRLCDTRLGCSPALAGLKHLNRLEQVLARNEWGDEFQEGLMLDGDGRLIEGVMSNLLLAREGRLLTPRLDRCGVAGTMLAELKAQAAAEGLELEERELRPDDLQRADELMLSNALIGLWPVRSLVMGGENIRWSPGPLYRRLSARIGQNHA